MKVKNKKDVKRTCFITRGMLGFGLLLFSFSAQASVVLRIDEEKVWLEADNAPIIDVFKSFMHAGAHVEVDPEIEGTVTGRAENEDINKTLETLLEPFDYVLFWKVIQGSLGAITKLDEMHVYLPGRHKRVKPMTRSRGNLTVTEIDGVSFIKDEILLRLKNGTTLTQLKALLAQIGGVVIDGLEAVRVYRVRVPPGTGILALLRSLEDHPVLARAEPNYAYDLDNPVGLGTSDMAGIKPVSIPEELKCAPPMAILDSGLTSVEGLGITVVGRYDALDPGRAITDNVGHGTQMALVAAGVSTPNGSSTHLESEGLPILAVKAFDDNGKSSSYDLMRSIHYALSQNAKVINMSWGTETDSQFMKEMTSYAKSKGLVLVASAGNVPSGKSVFPAAYPDVIGVGAMTEDGSIWSQSNYGDFVTLAAPGEASFPVGYKGPPGAYAGTSISGAYVARALTLYFAAHPDATPDQAVNALERSLTDGGSKGKDPHYGHGALDHNAYIKFIGDYKGCP